MQTYRLNYDLPSGYVQDWLILGPLVKPGEFDFRLDQTIEARWAALSLSRPAAAVIDRAPTQLDKVKQGEVELFWKLEHTLADHRVERSLLLERASHVQLWAFSMLFVEAAQTVSAELVTTCPAAVWMNGQPYPLHEPTASTEPAGCLPEFHIPLTLQLAAGENQLLLLLEDVGVSELTLSAKFQILPGKTSGELQVAIPVLSPETDYWKRVERDYANARLNRAVYSGTDEIILLGPEKQERIMQANMRLQNNSGQIFGEYQLPLLSGEPFSLAISGQLPSGEYQAMLMPPLHHYYESQFRPSRSIPFQVINDPLITRAAGSYSERRDYLLAAAERRGGLFGQLASLVSGHSNRMNERLLQSIAQSVNQGEAGSLLNLLGLLLVQALADRRPGEKILSPGLQTSIEHAITNFPYSAMALKDEVEQLVVDTCRVLGGERYADVLFAAEETTGSEVQAAGEKRVAEWLRQHAVMGFAHGTPDPDRLAAALAALLEYSSNEGIAELAAVSLDKLFFLLAARNWNGLPDPVGANLPGTALKSARQLPGSALGLLLWGEGMTQTNLAGAVCLASIESYELPEVIASIASDHSTPTWMVENNQGASGNSPASRYSLFMTAGYRLSSFLFEDTQHDCCLHAWQATLRPEAVVYTSDPGSYSQAAQRPAGFWRGNSRKPVVRQWKDALVCQYYGPHETELGFTHAYFPAYAFDETSIEGSWAFARAGDAYLALYADQGLQLVPDGADANRELRSTGATWLCQMGQRSEDGDFRSFCDQILSNTAPHIDGERIWWQTIRTDELLLTNGTQFTVNGETQAGGQAITSPYATLDRDSGIMTIQYQEQGLELSFD